MKTLKSRTSGASTSKSPPLSHVPVLMPRELLLTVYLSRFNPSAVRSIGCSLLHERNDRTRVLELANEQIGLALTRETTEHLLLVHCIDALQRGDLPKLQGLQAKVHEIFGEPTYFKPISLPSQ
jgi:hypothetical protein